VKNEDITRGNSKPFEKILLKKILLAKRLKNNTLIKRI